MELLWETETSKPVGFVCTSGHYASWTGRFLWLEDLYLVEEVSKDWIIYTERPGH